MGKMHFLLKFWLRLFIGIFKSPINWERAKRKAAKTFIPAILDGILSRQTKLVFCKGIFQRSKGSKKVGTSS